jgi:hypothetical protein
VVGIDCLKKTNDESLIKEAMTAKKQAKIAIKNESIISAEKALFGGKTRSEFANSILKKINSQYSKLDKAIDKSPVAEILGNQGNFGHYALDSLRSGKCLSANSVGIIESIVTKAISGNAKKGSAKYNEHLPEAKKLCKKVISISRKSKAAIEKLETERLEALSRKLS